MIRPLLRKSRLRYILLPVACSLLMMAQGFANDTETGTTTLIGKQLYLNFPDDWERVPDTVLVRDLGFTFEQAVQTVYIQKSDAAYWLDLPVAVVSVINIGQLPHIIAGDSSMVREMVLDEWVGEDESARSNANLRFQSFVYSQSEPRLTYECRLTSSNGDDITIMALHVFTSTGYVRFFGVTRTESLERDRSDFEWMINRSYLHPVYRYTHPDRPIVELMGGLLGMLVIILTLSLPVGAIVSRRGWLIKLLKGFTTLLIGAATALILGTEAHEGTSANLAYSAIPIGAAVVIGAIWAEVGGRVLRWIATAICLFPAVPFWIGASEFDWVIVWFNIPWLVSSLGAVWIIEGKHRAPLPAKPEVQTSDS